jgi:hypothetical protein
VIIGPTDVNKISGARGSLRWGYHVAGEIGPWGITRDKATKRYALSAAIVRHDPMRCRQRPLAFVVLLKAGRSWEWPIEALTIRGSTLVADLGPPVKEGSHGT